MRTSRAEAPGTPIRFRVSPDERQLLKDAAAATRSKNLSDFIRESALAAAAECMEGVPQGSSTGGVQVLTPRGVGR